MRLLLAAVLLSGAAAAQPVAMAPIAAASDAVGIELSPVEPVGQRASPILYWTGTALDLSLLAGGAYALVWGVEVANTENAGLGGPILLLFGSGVALVGAAAVGLAGYDLIRVLDGDDPFVARLIDPEPRALSP